MIARNLLIAVMSAIVGGVVTMYVLQPTDSATAASKSDRLSGPPTETAFLPERSGVPGSTH
ncbi:hypothetical protein EPK99_17205 [Neorhizobium lilium]|uniref:Uncharacterized protein n=1 Tax=Neorhizobium lilium TaxID=2503024 RepID=A0A444LC62_9HYPH|nr:hypothetical protein [Neorhizobium lilium]RWX75440.1 hypothetical protein EPK99_17205 [Neorhizobium lilium]